MYSMFRYFQSRAVGEREKKSARASEQGCEGAALLVRCDYREQVAVQIDEILVRIRDQVVAPDHADDVNVALFLERVRLSLRFASALLSISGVE